MSNLNNIKEPIPIEKICQESPIILQEGVYLYIIPIKRIPQIHRKCQVKTEVYNRKINESHVFKLQQSLDLRNVDIIIGHYLDEHEHIYHIIDGQHRWRAILNAFTDGQINDTNIKITLKVIECENENDLTYRIRSFNEHCQIFVSIEERKKDEKIDLLLETEVTFVNPQFSKPLKCFIKKNRPMINKDRFIKMLKRSEWFMSENTSIDQAMLLLKRINRKMRLKAESLLSELCEDNVKQVKEKNFYLGLKDFDFEKELILIQ